MTMTYFLGLSIAIIVVLLLFCIIERTRLFPDVRDILNRSNKNDDKVGMMARSVYFVLFAILACAAITMAKTYMFPSEKNKDTGKPYFSNIRYHVLAHDGYLLGKQFYLAHGMTQQSEGFPQEALWDSKDGEVYLNRKDSTITINQFTDPVYVRQSIINTYHLINQVIPDDVSKGFELYDQDNLIYRMEIEQQEDKCLYISLSYITPNSCIRDTSTFERIIQEGYPLLDIIAKSPRIDITESLERAFRDCYIVRKSIPMNGNVVDFEKNAPAPFVLMPGLSYYMQDNLTINHTTHPFDTTFHVRFSQYAWDNELRFYTGVGKHKTKEFRLTYPDSTHMQLEFLLPDMHQMREMDGRVFITSSVNAIADDAREGGFLFNKFLLDDNFNHINANMRYKVGTANDSLRLAVLDLNDQLTGDRHEYHGDERFYLKTINKTSDATQWIFEVKNMRETNKLKMNHIIWFVLLMLIAVLIRLGVDSLFDLRSLSLFELGVYVVFFALAMVRLLLGWRMSTFPPIENVQLPVFEKMTASIFDKSFWFIWLLPILVSIYSAITKIGDRKYWWFQFEKWREQKWTSLIDWCNQRICKKSPYKLNEYAIISAVFATTLIGLGLLGHLIDQLGRFCNIAFPLFCYFLAELWMEYRLQKQGISNEKPIRGHRFLHICFLIIYWLIQDKGYIIVFVAYLLLFEGGLRGLFNGKRHLNGWGRWSRYVISLCSFVVLYLILHWEGQIMIFIFSNLEYCIAISMLLLAAGLCMTQPQDKSWKLVKWISICALIVAAMIGIFEKTNGKDCYYQGLVNYTNSKVQHMRYRAEIQQLTKDEKIDDIIARSNFASLDIVFIMRSAHNQWFINQYIKAGKDLRKSHQTFCIQPHSDQGSTYPTQTTDLVVTRYILAEHGELAARFILILWGMLIILFILEVEMSSRLNVKCAGALILIFTVSLLVYLSATNRIVFIGQDFPMISIQSRVAFLFPWLLVTIPLFRSIYVRKNNFDDHDDTETDWKCILYAFLIASFTGLCFKTIEQKGKDQHESQFNVSTLIQSMSNVVDQINEKFTEYQYNELQHHQSAFRSKRIMEVWNDFRENGEYAAVYDKFCNDTIHHPFMASALQYFDQIQLNKTDVNQLLHLHRRGGICSLAINKRHYFIPAIMEEEECWTGDLRAAYQDPDLSVMGLNNHKNIKLDDNISYETNILQNSIRLEIPNLPLMRFNSEWVPGERPLLLLSSERGTEQKEYFCIELDTLEIKSRGKKNQIATAIFPGDIFALNKLPNGSKEPKTFYSAQLKEEGDYYIARNIWLNGHRRLFYPLGKESIWTYNYANLVSSALGDSTQENYCTAYKDTSIRLSIDYELTKDVYRLINQEMSQKSGAIVTHAQTRKRLEEFRDLEEDKQCDPLRNNMYYDKKNNRIRFKNENIETMALRYAVTKINKRLGEEKQAEKPLTKAIDFVLQRPFDFTCVAIDGDGHIRLLFDYTRQVRIDPNNIQNLSKLIRDLYIDGSSADERNLFGNKALQHIPMGPGSSFKPIAFTAITSKYKLDWKGISLTQEGLSAAQTSEGVEGQNKQTKKFAYYGGIDIENEAYEHPLSLDVEKGYYITDYIVKSDNLFHSIIVMLGLQTPTNITSVMCTPPSDPKKAFPVFIYKGQRQSFNPEIWYNNGTVYQKDHLLEAGLIENFRIGTGASRVSDDAHVNYFGNDTITQYIFDYPSSARDWSFAEKGSQNAADRRHKPVIGKCLNQMVLGASPLKQSALQMAINGSRLISLNRAEHITTLMDGSVNKQFQPFSLGEGWDSTSYLEFIRDILWTQMRKVPTEGTASLLKGFTNSVLQGKYGRPYYLYCKTGTLDDDRNIYMEKNAKEIRRIKHLMVIITDTDLSEIKKMADLQKVRYYVIYMSYMGILKSEYSSSDYAPYIESVIQSTTFREYMNPQNK